MKFQYLTVIKGDRYARVFRSRHSNIRINHVIYIFLTVDDLFQDRIITIVSPW